MSLVAKYKSVMEKRGERKIEMIHLEDKESSGEEEDGKSNDARNSLKKRRRGTILKLTHRRKVQRDHRPTIITVNHHPPNRYNFGP